MNSVGSSKSSIAAPSLLHPSLDCHIAPPFTLLVRFARANDKFGRLTVNILKREKSLTDLPPPPTAVRRSSYHDVVKIADMQKICSVQHVQSYVINGSKVFFLKRRPQPRPPKGAVGASQCVVCSRHMADMNLYCSLQCMLDGENGVILDESHYGQPETPLARSNIRPFKSSATSNSSGSDSDHHADSHMSCKRRKALPKRAPMA